MDGEFVLSILRYVLVALLTSGVYALVMSLYSLRQSKKGRSANTPTPRRGNMLRFLKDSEQFNSSWHKTFIGSFAALPIGIIAEIVLLLNYGYEGAALLIEGLIAVFMFVMIITFLVAVMVDDRVRIKNGWIAYRAGGLQGLLRFDEIRDALYVEQKKAVVIYLKEGTELAFFHMLNPKGLAERINHGVADGETATEP